MHPFITVQQPTFSLDAEGALTASNDDFFHLFKEPLTGVPFTACLDAEDAMRFNGMLRDVKEGVPAQQRFRFYADGLRRAALITLSPFFKAGIFDGYHGLIWEDPSQRRKLRLLNKVKAIFENDLECVKILDLNGHLLDINPTGVEMMDAPDKLAILGMNCIEAVLPQDRQQYASLLEHARRGLTHRAEFRAHSLQGNLRWMDAKAVPLLEEDRRVYAIMMMGRDITERKAIEAGLRESQELAVSNAHKMLLIAESTNDCLFIVNAAGKIEFYNQKTKEAIGIEGDHLIGMPVEEAMMSVNAIQFLPRYQQALAGQQPMQFEDYYHHRSMWVEVHVYPANGGIVVYFRNINERKEAELKLALSEQKFKAMVHNGSDIIAVLDANMCVQYLSPTTARIAGYEPEELLGKSIIDFIHPDELALVANDFNEVLELKHPGIETTHRFLHRDGHYIWLESKANNLIQEDNIGGIIINARDITHHKSLQEKLDAEVNNRQKVVTAAVIRAQERERSQLGQELHDNVNQVLTTIKLYNEMVLEGLGTVQDLLPRSVHHLQGCINEIRSISKRLSAPTLGKISLKDSIRELVDSVNLTNRLKIRYQISGLESCTVSEDLHLAIYRIIQEKLNNTLKYAQASTFSIDICNDACGLHISLADNGKGFDPTEKSAGIGITNMKTRAENLNGTFLLFSNHGEGCQVRVVFPPVVL